MAKTRYLLLGAGDVAREVTAILGEIAHQSGPEYEIACFSDNPDAIAPCFKLSCSSQSDALERFPPGSWRAICCVGSPSSRASFYDRFRELGYRFISVCHPGATSYADTIGDGSVVFPGARLAVGARIGRNVIVNFGATIGHDTVIGDHSVVNPGAQLSGRISGGARVLYGINCSVLQGKTIGDGAVIAAGSSAWFDVPPNVTVVGVPGRPRRYQR